MHRKRGDHVDHLPFLDEEYLAAFRAAGLEMCYDSVGLLGCGLYLRVRPAATKHSGAGRSQ